MELLVSCSGWGIRKAALKAAGVYRLDFERGCILQRAEFPITPGAARGFSGLTYDDRFIYAARPVDNLHDSIVRFDRSTLQPLSEWRFRHLSDCHQLDTFAGLLWLTNTNYHEVVVVDPRQVRIVQRHQLTPGIAAEHALTEQARDPMGDYRQRPHINSIQVQPGSLQVGLFGLDRGRFHSPQLVGVRWQPNPRGLAFGSCTVLARGLGWRYPHNVHHRPDGTLVGCSSQEGKFYVGSTALTFTGWTRGLAISSDSYFVGLSSHSYSSSLGCGVEPTDGSERPAAIVRIDRRTLKVTGKFEFEENGQLFDIRLANEPDYGMSACADRDPIQSSTAMIAAAETN